MDKLHNKELHNLIPFRVNKTRGLRRAEHVPKMGEGRNVYEILIGYSTGKNTLENSLA